VNIVGSNLKSFLASLSAGPVTDAGQLVHLLLDVWDSLPGSCSEKMAAHKLWRMERVEWHPPFLSFIIERHGGTVSGSTRAELQHWSVDIEHWSAACDHGGHRQLVPMRKRLDVKPIAEEIARAIVDQRPDPRIQLLRGGSGVRVRMSKAMPKADTPRQTLAGRRKRLRSAIRDYLTSHGWQESSANGYSRVDNC